jgi:hypothetical protein
VGASDPESIRVESNGMLGEFTFVDGTGHELAKGELMDQYRGVTGEDGVRDVFQRNQRTRLVVSFVGTAATGAGAIAVGMSCHERTSSYDFCRLQAGTFALAAGIAALGGVLTAIAGPDGSALMTRGQASELAARYNRALHHRATVRLGLSGLEGAF